MPSSSGHFSEQCFEGLAGEEGAVGFKERNVEVFFERVHLYIWFLGVVHFCGDADHDFDHFDVLGLVGDVGLQNVVEFLVYAV